MASTQFDRRKVRVVAKIRGFSGPEANSGTVDWVSVNRENSEDVTISFGKQSSSRYLVDYCYKEHEDNELIYSREVKPLVSAVFEGQSSTVIAHGARGSGKTHLIQGSTETPGLAVLAMGEFLSMAEKNGKSIAVSFYEVDHQEHAVDLINPEQSPILIFEDRGRIQFKGLTQTPIKSIAEFQNLYCIACSAQKAPKRGCEYARRSHMGLIVNVFSQNESIEGLVSKMNFVDMAGYEDARKKSSDISGLAETNKINKSIYAGHEDVRKKSSDISGLAETNKINKSIYSLMNVCHALSTNENRVPYRESKLTRLLQDSLRGPGKILLVSCLNPSFCQDSIYMVSLASRSCQWIQRTNLVSTTTSGISAKQMVASHKNQTPLGSTIKSGNTAKKMVTSHKNQVPKSVSATAKKISRSHINEKKATAGMKSAVKARKLFDEAGHSSSKAEKARSLADTSSSFETSMQEKEISIADVTKASEPLLGNSLLEAGDHVELNSVVEFDKCVMQDNSFPDASYNVKLNLMVENDNLCLNASSEVETDSLVEMDHQEKHTPDVSTYSKPLSIVQEGHNMNKENNSIMANGDSSPPISSQLRDLSNSLKMLYSSTPLCTQIPEKECMSVQDQMSSDIVEPKTPVIEQNMCFNYNVMNSKSPWETFSMRGSGMKNSLVQEYLRFLNTADKEDLKKLKGIGEKRATFILELREESPEPFKSLDDLKDIGLSAKQIKGIMKKEVGELFN